MVPFRRCLPHSISPLRKMDSNRRSRSQATRYLSRKTLWQISHLRPPRASCRNLVPCRASARRVRRRLDDQLRYGRRPEPQGVPGPDPLQFRPVGVFARFDASRQARPPASRVVDPVIGADQLYHLTPVQRIEVKCCAGHGDGISKRQLRYRRIGEETSWVAFFRLAGPDAMVGSQRETSSRHSAGQRRNGRIPDGHSRRRLLAGDLYCAA